MRGFEKRRKTLVNSRLTEQWESRKHSCKLSPANSHRLSSSFDPSLKRWSTSVTVRVIWLIDKKSFVETLKFCRNIDIIILHFNINGLQLHSVINFKRVYFYPDCHCFTFLVLRRGFKLLIFFVSNVNFYLKICFSRLKDELSLFPLAWPWSKNEGRTICWFKWK